MLEVAGDCLASLCRLCGEVDSVNHDLFDEKAEEDELLSKIELAIRISVSYQLNLTFNGFSLAMSFRKEAG